MAVLEDRIGFDDLLYRKKRHAGATGEIYKNYYALIK
jgi:hypothetical protein